MQDVLERPPASHALDIFMLCDGRESNLAQLPRRQFTTIPIPLYLFTVYHSLHWGFKLTTSPSLTLVNKLVWLCGDILFKLQIH